MKKVLSILLAAVMLFTMIPANVFAAEGTTVKLVSFMRGDVDDLRSSELLEVQVEGYEGNPRELTYKWTSSLGTYLYIYNSHNMYGINNTYGEMEIYNTDKNVKRSSNVEEDRSGNKTLTKEGFMWASVYGAYEYSKISASTALKGTVTVEVFDKNGKSLGSDSFSSFKAHNLDYDLDNVVIGLFEGDRKNVLDLLGESGIVHITCDQSKVSSAEIIEGDKHIAIESEKKDKNTYNYYIKGVKAGNNSTNGDAQLEINIKKTSCKFHYSTSGTAQPIVYVFKKPTTTTTTTTLILNKDSIPPLHDRCRCRLEELKAILAGMATKNGAEGADYWLKNFAVLPEYYITKTDIAISGWRWGKSPVKYAPGKMIGGDIYFNRNAHLPSAPGRIWYECDINYYSGKRNGHRILYSNDGLIFVTYNHYRTFYEIM